LFSWTGDLKVNRQSRVDPTGTRESLVLTEYRYAGRRLQPILYVRRKPHVSHRKQPARMPSIQVRPAIRFRRKTDAPETTVIRRYEEGNARKEVHFAAASPPRERQAMSLRHFDMDRHQAAM